jgi:hypothetical protein
MSSQIHLISRTYMTRLNIGHLAKLQELQGLMSMKSNRGKTPGENNFSWGIPSGLEK